MRILFAIDGSEEATAGMVLLCRMAFPSGTRARVLTVCGAAQLESDSARKLLAAAEPLILAGWSVESVVATSDQIAEAILESAEGFEADLIVMGSRGQGAVKRFLLGSVADRVVRYSDRSVLISKPAPESTASPGENAGSLRILLAYDGSESAKAALARLSRMPLRESTHVKILTVLRLITAYRMDIIETSSPLWEKERDAARQELDEAQETLSRSGVSVETQLLESGDPAAEVTATAQEMGAELIVVGDRGRNRASRILLGSVAESVIHHGSCSVLLVKTPSAD